MVKKQQIFFFKKDIKQASFANSGKRGMLFTTCCVTSTTENFIPSANDVFKRKSKKHILNSSSLAALGLVHFTG